MQTLPDSSKSLKLNQEEIKHPNNRTKKSPDIYIKKKQKNYVKHHNFRCLNPSEKVQS